MSAPRQSILLLSPPNAFLENPHSVPRIGLLYLGTVLRNAGHAVTIRHLKSLGELEALVADSLFDFIGISATTREYLDAVQILNYLKRERHPATVSIGGPHATALPEECQRNGFDVVVIGEADNEIERLVFLHPKQPQIVHCGFIQELDLLPCPDRTLLDKGETWQPFLYLGQAQHIRATSILLSRGCPYHCAFCGPHFKYRRRSDSGIEAELRLLCQQGYVGLVILDDLPFVHEEQVRAFCRLIRPLHMKFRCNFRPDLLNPPIAEILAEAGCCRVQVGIESATQGILEAVKKGTQTDSNGQAISICHDYGIQVKAMFIWGLPGDGPETADALVSWLERYRPDSIQISSFVPLPGSPLWGHGYHRSATDYCALSFFGHRGCSATASGVGNDRFSAEELWAFREEILSRCAQFTHLDLGLPDERSTNSPVCEEAEIVLAPR